MPKYIDRTEAHVGEERWVRDDEDGNPVYISIECGDWFGGYVVLCDECAEDAAERYPQGWNYYPGDRCVHGAYVGGSGPDYMCHRCEMGYTKPVLVKRYRFYLTLGDSAPMEMTKHTTYHDSDAHPATVNRELELTWARLTLYWVRDAYALSNMTADGTRMSTYAVVDEYTEWREE